MAVLDSLPGIEVSICINGEVVKEYIQGEDDHQVEEGDQILDDEEVSKHQKKVEVVKYIEASTGGEFVIRLGAKHPFDPTGRTLEFDVFVDGKCLNGMIMAANTFKEGASSFVFKGRMFPTRTGMTIKSMKFAPIDMSKASSHLTLYKTANNPFLGSTASSTRLIEQDLARIGGLGNITVKVHEVLEMRDYTEVDNEGSLDFHHNPVVQEKSLIISGKSHRTM
jgi:hypothetical protein